MIANASCQANSDNSSLKQTFYNEEFDFLNTQRLPVPSCLDELKHAYHELYPANPNLQSQEDAALQQIADNYRKLQFGPRYNTIKPGPDQYKHEHERTDL